MVDAINELNLRPRRVAHLPKCQTTMTYPKTHGEARALPWVIHGVTSVEVMPWFLIL